MPANPHVPAELALALERHRAALHALEGVVSTGIGRRTDDGALCIQIFVTAAERVARVTAAAARIVGETPFDVAITGEASAGDRPE
jgi:hypothetical protein